MAKKTQAQIEFSAATKDFDAGIKSMNAQLKTFGNELKLNSTQLKGNADDVGLLQDRQKILQAELEASKNKVKLQEQALEKCKEMLGENSTEYRNLTNSLLNAKNQQAAIENEIKKTEQALANASQETKEAASAYDNLSEKIDEQESELSKLAKEYKEVVLTQGKGSKEAKELEGKINELNGELQDNKKKLKEADSAAEDLTEEFDEAGDKAEGFNGKLAVLGAGFAALAAAAFEAGKACIDAFNEVDEGADNVIKATGATGEAAAELEASYQKVASSVVGDFGDIGKALGEVNTRFGFTGSQAEEATTRFMKFSEVTGMDATQAVQDVSRAIESAGLKSSDYSSILDSLTKAGQATGVSVDTLAGSLTDNGAVMREMGYDTNETIAMLAQFEKAGVNSQTVTKGMQKAIINWAKDGKDAQKEFGKMVEGIQNGSIKAGDAYEVFGSKAGVELVDAIKSGRFEYSDMLSVIEGSKGALDSTFDGTVDGGYELELAMQNCKLALSEVGEVVGTALTPVFQTVSERLLPAVAEGFEKLQKAWQWLSEHTGLLITVASVIGVITTAITAYNVVQGIKNAMDAANVTTVWALVSAHLAQAAAAIAAVAPYILIVAAIAAVIAIIVLCVKNWDKIKEKITEVAQKTKEKVIEIKNNITEKLNAAKQKAVEIFTNIRSAISEKITALKEKVSSIFSSIKEKIVTPINNAKTAVSNAIENLRSGFVNKANSLKEKAASIFNSLKEKLTSPVQKARDTIKGIVDKIKNIFNFKWSLPKLKIPHISVTGGKAPFGIGGQGSLPKFSIKWNAKGGLFTQPTVFAQGFGEAGHEYAIPLNERSVEPLAAMINKLSAQSGGSGLSEAIASRFDMAVDKLADRLERLEMAVNIDGERVATALAAPTDRIGGTRYELINRGLAIK